MTDRGWIWITNSLAGQTIGWLLAGKVQGRPQATKTASVEELERMGVIGIYEPTDDNPPRIRLEHSPTVE